MNKNKLRKILCATVITFILLALSAGALAASNSRQLTATYNDIKIFVNGMLITPTDATGKSTEPFIVDGTTYLPVRAVAAAFDQPVEWDAATQSVYIGEKPLDAGGEVKIAIISSDVTQNEEDYYSAEEVVKKYGADKVVHVTWPAYFMQEQEEMITIAGRLAADPNIKVLIINQAVPGTLIAIDKLRETRPDIFIVLCEPQENPPDVMKRANLVLAQDELSMGPAMVQQAKKLGAKTFVHYSFPRHMSIILFSDRRELIRKECAKLGIEFIDATIPDPISEVGIAGARQYILENVPYMIAQYGKDTAFFSTNCAMQMSLIKAVSDGGGIYPQPCCPSPYHGFAAALSINNENSDMSKQGAQQMSTEIARILKKKGVSGRFSTWPVPVSMLITSAAADYAFKWVAGEVPKEGLDMAVLQKCLDDYAGVKVYAEPLEYEDYWYSSDGPVIYDNWLMLREDYITY